MRIVPRRKQLHFSEKIIYTSQKRYNFVYDNYIFPKKENHYTFQKIIIYERTIHTKKDTTSHMTITFFLKQGKPEQAVDPFESQKQNNY